MQNLLTRKELAAMLKVSLKTVDNLIKEKAIPMYRIGNSVRFDPVEVLEYFRANCSRISSS